MNFVVSNNNNGVSLELPFIYYLGYDIKINENNIEYTESNNGFISINLPKNQEGEIKITYKGTIIEKISFAISIPLPLTKIPKIHTISYKEFFLFIICLILIVLYELL